MTVRLMPKDACGDSQKCMRRTKKGERKREEGWPLWGRSRSPPPLKKKAVYESELEGLKEYVRLADQEFQRGAQGAASQPRPGANSSSLPLMLLKQELKRRLKAGPQEQDDGSNAPLQEQVDGQPPGISPSSSSGDTVILD
jgi:hypothetical protein